MIALEMALSGIDFNTAKLEVFRVIGRAVWRTVVRHLYTDESGEPLFRALRREQTTDGQCKKKFSLERLEAGRWWKGLGTVRTVPYRLHKIVTQSASSSSKARSAATQSEGNSSYLPPPTPWARATGRRISAVTLKGST